MARAVASAKKRLGTKPSGRSYADAQHKRIEEQDTDDALPRPRHLADVKVQAAAPRSTAETGIAIIGNAPQHRRA